MPPRPSILVAAAAFICATHAGAGDRPAPKRLLIVYAHEATLPAVRDFDAGVTRALAGTPSTEVELFLEFLDLGRFPSPAHRRRVTANLIEKYRHLRPDAVLAAGTAALDLMLAHRDEIAPGAPIVFGGVNEPAAEALDLPPDVEGLIGAYDLPGTVRLAARLQPDARRLVVMTGSGAYDRMWERDARGLLGDAFEGLEVDYVRDLPLDGFIETARRLDPRTILLFLSLFEDTDGRLLNPRDAGARIAAESGAPAYTVYSTLVGSAFVGGAMTAFEDMGRDVAKLALRALDGKREEVQIRSLSAAPIVDWRALQRWGLDPARLPDDARILFHDASAWERYRWQIALAVAVLLLQSATIAGLVVAERRRRGVEKVLASERLELAHLSRGAQIGALSGSLVHELNQPLTSILANAEAGARLAARDPADMDEIRAILDDIAADDRRAAAVISQLRPMMQKGETTMEPVDLAAAATSTVALADNELAARRTRVIFLGERHPLPVMGNPVQLKQVILNLLMNAAEAMADLPASRRRIEIEARRREDGWAELSVSDQGPGLPDCLRGRAFQPFVSTKAEGMGLGLAISEAIAKAHGGRLEFEEGRAQGVRAILLLPPRERIA